MGVQVFACDVSLESDHVVIRNSRSQFKTTSSSRKSECTTLADRVADSFAPSDRDADLFSPSENKEAGNLQELPTAFLLVTNKDPLDSG